jgi:hypothetical protein
LSRQLLAVALRTFRFLVAIDQGFELVVTALAQVFENRHGVAPGDTSNSQIPFKISEWGIGNLMRLLYRAAGCAVGMCKP